MNGVYFNTPDSVCKFPAQTIYLSDANCFNTGWASATPYKLNRVGDAYDGSGNITRMRHNDMVNALFVDGHVKVVKPSGQEMSTDINSPWTGVW